MRTNNAQTRICYFGSMKQKQRLLARQPGTHICKTPVEQIATSITKYPTLPDEHEKFEHSSGANTKKVLTTALSMTTFNLLAPMDNQSTGFNNYIQSAHASRIFSYKISSSTLKVFTVVFVRERPFFRKVRQKTNSIMYLVQHEFHYKDKH